MSGSKTEYTKVTGSITECMERAKSHGLMEDATKASINMTRNMASELSSGPMEENTSVTGKMESSTDVGSTTFRVGRRKSESGFKGRKLNGLRRMLEKVYEINLIKEMIWSVINFNLFK